MPDWTYHPLFKPLLFRLPPEEARAATMKLLAIQGSTAAGRLLFRWFAPPPPSERHGVEVFGLQFPSPVGLAPGIDVDAEALSVLQYLGFGFLEVGPVGAEARARRHALDPLRILERHAIVSAEGAAGPSAAAVAARVRASPELGVPIGVAVSGDRMVEAIVAARDAASFFTLPSSAAEPGLLAQLRAATEKPLLLALSPEWDDARIDATTDAARAAGIDGCIAVEGARSPLLPEGRMEGPFLVARALAVTARVVRRHGDALPVVGAGGVTTPHDATALLDAGARLVHVGSGLVYAGPGLPARILGAIEDGGAAPAPSRPSPPSAREPLPFGPRLVWLTGQILVASGLFALLLAATVKLLPYDVAYLRMTVADLCDRDACRIVHFMAHDRVSFGGSMISIGVLYVYLARAVARREAWAFWALLISGIVGFGSFMTYLGYGYLDVWHGRATLALIPVYAFGMLRSFRDLPRPRGPRELLRIGARAYLWSPAGMGRLAMTFTAFGMIAGGAIIMAVGMTRVFVPQDLEFMQVTAAQIHAINPRLVPLIAHDRAGFGGGLCSTGLAVMACVWRGVRPGDRELWRAMLIAGVVGFATAIGIHPIVGYTSFTHLAPAIAGAVAFAVGMRLLYAPMCRVDGLGGDFPDV